MSSFKHSGDPAADKPDRRRGAAGRAAALRRAPSDSDCSGETASLSADSGERRPPPPPPRTKTRNRRRGSEWEVLEGLKDGQRFERRPEVFNGFLHKKRKWPLKGWHKRFFVVDGGILVYARSPTDVARGRLHGSLDVGLSVISAKPRRRRIDIDADEFIYHLRAKTPDVFRTWLNVLKAHRLYRQHLLTFGARESVPKIHAPLDDLPPTDTSTRTSHSGIESFSSLTQTQSESGNLSKQLLNERTSSVHENESQNTLSRSKRDENSPILIEPECSNLKASDNKVLKTGSHFSTHCIKKRSENRHESYRILPAVPLSADEQQIHSTNLDLNTLNSYNTTSETTSELKSITNESSKKSNKGSKNTNYEVLDNKVSKKNSNVKLRYKQRQEFNTLDEITHIRNNKNKKIPVWLDNTDQATLFCFPRNPRNRFRNEEAWTMKRSRKSTNLVKYKNVSQEPCLTTPLLRQMLLCKYKHSIVTRNEEDKGVNCFLTNTDKRQTDKSTQDAVTVSEYDNICEKLMFNLFDTHDHNIDVNGEGCISATYVNHVVKELYALELKEREKHPIKMLFKYLLQYFLKNTEGKFKGTIKQDIAINKPSFTYFTSSKAISTYSNIIDNPTEVLSFKYTQDSQDLEKLINNTIYGCSIITGKSREKDIQITKALINNLDEPSTKFSNADTTKDLKENATESSELPVLQEYFKHFLSETLLPKDVAKDLLRAYLDILDYSRSATSAESIEISRTSHVLRDPISNTQKKVSKSVSACITTFVGDTESRDLDRGPFKFKDLVDKIIATFTNRDNEEFQKHDHTDTNNVDNKDTVRCERKLEDHASKSLLSSTANTNKIVLDLLKYEVDNISLSNNSDSIGPKCITINLKEKPLNSDASKLTNLSIDCGSHSQSDNLKYVKPNYPIHIKTFMDDNNKKYQVPYDEADAQTHSVSSGTSKAEIDICENDYDMPGKDNRSSKELLYPKRKDNTQCFFISSIKEDSPDKIKKLKKSHGFVRRPLQQTCTNKNRVNEDFIFRILEHLIVLSKDIPRMNKEIYSLFAKLKDDTSNMALPGISTLGKIYNIENTRIFKEESNIHSSLTSQIRRNIKEKAIEIAVNTSLLFSSLKTVEDRALSAIIFADALANIAVQTLPNNEVKERPEIEENEWFKRLTQEYVKNNAIKCMLKKYNLLPQSIRIAHPIQAKIPERLILSKNSLMLKELSNLSPPLTFSSCSQKNEPRILETFEQLYKRAKSKLAQSESRTDSSIIDINNEMSDDLKTLYRCSSVPSYCSGLISPNAGPIRGPQAGFVSGTPGGRLASWNVESGGPLESASRELGQAQLSVQQLQRLLDAMLELQNIHHHDTDVSLEGASPNVKKDRRKFGLRKKKSNSKCASVELVPPHVDPSGSHMALSALTAPPSPGGGSSSMPNSAASLPIACAAARPQSLPGAEALSVGAGAGPTSITSLTPDHQLREDFTILAKDLVANLKTVVSTLVVERGRLRAAMEAADTPAAGGVVAALRTNLSSALQQNSELRSRLSRIHDASDLAEISSVGNNSDQQVTRPFPQSLSYSSSCVSASEFFDAEEHDDELKPADIITTDEAGVIELDGDSSSEAGSLSSEEGSASSDNSDGATSAVIPAEGTPLQNGSEPLPTICTRRSRLPCPRPTPASPSLWNLLYKNIGKDLSQISMPVTINEPLNMLQRLCEELEYSELLDSASSCNNALERMSLVAAFAVSAYAASAHRAASKPFNPLLAETYEYVRGDRDFRFIAEQVSHHPPISACHAESPRWTFWQEARIKTKFWGKSMEFQPTGRVHVRLTPSGDHYSWNKVTTCVHNLFGGQRWVDQYGDMHIVCHGTDITCKLQFIKASSWSSSRHEVRGAVMVGGSTRMRLTGRWSEGLQGGERTLWRPGAMPSDYELYYGFTRFAMELNELEPGMRDVLPSTDTRLRPDQRALEEGDVDAAEQFKHELEQAQRERRRDGIEHSPLWFRKTVEDGEETWVFTGEYWKAREAGFSHTPRLW